MLRKGQVGIVGGDGRPRMVDIIPFKATVGGHEAMATIRVDATVKRGIHDAGRGESLGRSVGVLIFDVIKTSAEVCFPDLIFIRVVANEAVGDGPLLMLDP